ncbi:MAG TPA: hypothetical protein VGF59_06775 [Bryobacteraceae bacterium]|jgi:hypothetical protein
MDLRQYYKKIRDVEATIGETFPVIVSLETAEGGRAGKRTETPKRIAAKMVVDGFARLATPEEMKEFRDALAEAKRKAEEAAAAAATKLHVTFVPPDQLKRSKG